MTVYTNVVSEQTLNRVMDLRDQGLLNIHIVHMLYDDLADNYVVLWSSRDPSMRSWMALLC